MKCPFCEQEVTELKLYVLEENKYHLEYNPEMASPDWSASEVVDLTAQKMAAFCGFCDLGDQIDKRIGLWTPGFSTAWGKEYGEIDYVEWIEHLLEVNKDV